MNLCPNGDNAGAVPPDREDSLIEENGSVLTVEFLAFVRSSLPTPPARVLEIGAGRGEMARALIDAGYEVTAIDPAAEPGTQVQPVALIDADGVFDAAVAVVSLHPALTIDRRKRRRLTGSLPDQPNWLVVRLESERSRGGQRRAGDRRAPRGVRTVELSRKIRACDEKPLLLIGYSSHARP